MVPFIGKKNNVHWSEFKQVRGCTGPDPSSQQPLPDPAVKWKGSLGQLVEDPLLLMGRPSFTAKNTTEYVCTRRPLTQQ